MISTVLNEEKNIDFFIKSLLNQTKRPNEIIIVDGGSTDKTYEILKKFSNKNKILKVYQKKGLNISQGRNYAISKAKNEIIAGVDAGTKYNLDWLEKMSKGFRGDFCFGKTLPLINSHFQKILAKKMRQQFGSARNMIFKKSVWHKVGGYPEDMKIAEDSVFYARLEKKGVKIYFIPDAVGYWEMRKNLKELEKQFYKYGYWGGIGYKKYKILNTKRRFVIFLLTISIPLYPLFWFLSKFSYSIKMSITMRYSYLKGFYKGFFNMKE